MTEQRASLLALALCVAVLLTLLIGGVRGTAAGPNMPPTSESEAP